MSYRRLLLALLVLLLAATASAAPQTYEIRASASRRVITIDDGKIVKSEAVFKEGRELQELSKSEFTIFFERPQRRPHTTIYSAKSVYSSLGRVVEILQSNNESLKLKIVFNDPSMEVLLVYSARPLGFISKSLTINPIGKPVFIDSINLEAFMRPANQIIGFEVPGQPIYTEDSFIATAYPSALNFTGRFYTEPWDGKSPVLSGPYNDYGRCDYLVGLTVTDSYTSYPLIYGVAPAGQDVREFFQAAVESMRARPVKPFLLWNSWYHVFDFTDTQIVTAINDFKQKLIDPFGIRIDSFVMDDGWDDYRHAWQPHPTRFPNGFRPVADAAAAANSHIGLWMSPAGGYGNGHLKRTFFATGSGYETNKFGFCIAGRNYGRAFGDYLTGYMRDSGANYFKFDNIDSKCQSDRHGHRSGEYAQVALTDAFIGVMQRARAENPDVAINITVGSWLSPFWTIWCDFVWRTGMDFSFAGPGSLRQQSITYVDTILFEKLRDEQLQFPINSLMTHGIIKGLRQNFGETKNTPPRDFFDDVWMYFGRGVMMQELYLSPELLTDAEWKELARAITWSHAHHQLVAQSQMILGDPRKLEVYGFRSRLGQETLLVLRNPSLFEKPAPADELSACPNWQVVYASTGAGADRPLATMETRVLYCAGE